uniref:Uncharacterized protein n=1 Tax=Chromera velia CCMP2878 TaxID=1169474 RepID=A0A0G4HHR7_9ALVE|eukprot:Cvel_27572.t1-p1 / transcript=Cvel_27572.t1 / gene=Cvel_27572 / organism=Chromera_velia_CCMP2878 / gene_product=hypothetical protein / transcript_product=hypothetical protein / location=Cvel_scaffold3465:7554-10826(-) / protein_length=1091 / sequence_SO=supercontig / SO=protein_coding / is_pseudo=false
MHAGNVKSGHNRDPSLSPGGAPSPSSRGAPLSPPTVIPPPNDEASKQRGKGSLQIELPPLATDATEPMWRQVRPQHNTLHPADATRPGGVSPASHHSHGGGFYSPASAASAVAVSLPPPASFWDAYSRRSGAARGPGAQAIQLSVSVPEKYEFISAAEDGKVAFWEVRTAECPSLALVSGAIVDTLTGSVHLLSANGGVPLSPCAAVTVSGSPVPPGLSTFPALEGALALGGKGGERENEEEAGQHAEGGGGVRGGKGNGGGERPGGGSGCSVFRGMPPSPLKDPLTASVEGRVRMMGKLSDEACGVSEEGGRIFPAPLPHTTDDGACEGEEENETAEGDRAPDRRKEGNETEGSNVEKGRFSRAFQEEAVHAQSRPLWANSSHSSSSMFLHQSAVSSSSASACASGGSSFSSGRCASVGGNRSRGVRSASVGTPGVMMTVGEEGGPLRSPSCLVTRSRGSGGVHWKGRYSDGSLQGSVSPPLRTQIPAPPGVVWKPGGQGGPAPHPHMPPLVSLTIAEPQKSLQTLHSAKGVGENIQRNHLCDASEQEEDSHSPSHSHAALFAPSTDFPTAFFSPVTHSRTLSSSQPAFGHRSRSLSKGTHNRAAQRHQTTGGWVAPLHLKELPPVPADCDDETETGKEREDEEPVIEELPLRASPSSSVSDRLTPAAPPFVFTADPTHGTPPHVTRDGSTDAPSPSQRAAAAPSSDNPAVGVPSPTAATAATQRPQGSSPSFEQAAPPKRHGERTSTGGGPGGVRGSPSPSFQQASNPKGPNTPTSTHSPPPSRGGGEGKRGSADVVRIQPAWLSASRPANVPAAFETVPSAESGHAHSTYPLYLLRNSGGGSPVVVAFPDRFLPSMAVAWQFVIHKLQQQEEAHHGHQRHASLGSDTTSIRPFKGGGGGRTTTAAAQRGGKSPMVSPSPVSLAPPGTTRASKKNTNGSAPSASPWAGASVSSRSPQPSRTQGVTMTPTPSAVSPVKSSRFFLPGPISEPCSRLYPSAYADPSVQIIRPAALVRLQPEPVTSVAYCADTDVSVFQPPQRTAKGEPMDHRNTSFGAAARDSDLVGRKMRGLLLEVTVTQRLAIWRKVCKS